MLEEVLAITHTVCVAFTIASDKLRENIKKSSLIVWDGLLHLLETNTPEYGQRRHRAGITNRCDTYRLHEIEWGCKTGAGLINQNESTFIVILQMITLYQPQGCGDLHCIGECCGHCVPERISMLHSDKETVMN